MKQEKTMKNLMKLLIVAIVFTIATESYAQTFGVKAGLNLSNMLVKDDTKTYSNDFKMNPGFHVGATVEFPISEMFSFETGLLISTKGVAISVDESLLGESIKYDYEMNLFYLDIPLTAKASFDLGAAKIYGVFGPYMGVGLVEYIKYTLGDYSEAQVDFDSFGNGTLKTLDFGLIMGAGVEISAIQIGFSYGLGLANIGTSEDYSWFIYDPSLGYNSPSSDGGLNVKNRVLMLSVGYKFGGK